MGVKPTPDEVNDFCPRCFPVDETPEQLIMFTAGIQISDSFPPAPEPAPNGKCYLHQFDPSCHWLGENDLFWRAFFSFRPTGTYMSIEISLDYFAFVARDDEQCHRYFTNGHDDPGLFQYWGGYAVILTPTEIFSLVNSVLPVEMSDARFEVAPKADQIIVIRYASIKQNTNIELEFDLS